jgi:glycosyltransferase involved in cell wall biosynthesis
MRFIFFGRLEQEKGFDILLKAMERLHHKHLFLIFGQGSLRENLLKQNFPINDLSTLQDEEILRGTLAQTGVFFFGFRDFEKVIAKFLQNKVDCNLMPSKFLETFGFSALESLKFAIPTIAPNKGGLRDLIFGEYALREASDIALIESIENFQLPTPALKILFNKKLQNFSAESFHANLQKILPPNTKKIILVSDYSEKIGGTEIHIAKLQKLLQESNFQVENFFGKEKGKVQFFDFIKQIIRPKTAKKLQAKIDQFQPDLIWCHSISRVLGKRAISRITNSKAYKIITHHDLALFSLYPSKIESETAITTELDFQSLLQTTPNLTLSQKAFGFLKYLFIIKPIRKLLKKFDQQIIISNFMKKLFPPEYQTTQLPHFF